MAIGEVEKTVTALPLELVVDEDGEGGLGGLSPLPTVAIRDAAVLGVYLDWDDMTFKSTGWVQRLAAMTDVGDGHYNRYLNVAALSLGVGAHFVAEFKVNTSAARGEDADVFLITDKRTNIELVRKYHTNKMHEASGNPGTLLVYDDDDVTVLKTHQLRDESGGAIGPSVATPARRSKGA